MPWPFQVLLLTALYVLTGQLGLSFTHVGGNYTLVWLSAGLSLAALILFGRRLWPGIFLGTLLVSLSTPLGWIPSLGGAVGTTLEAVVGVTLLRAADFRPSLDRMRDGVVFLLIGVIGCTMIGATIGSVSMLLSADIQGAEFGLVWLIWWLGDAGGILIMTPVLLMVVNGTPSWASLVRRLESWFVLALLLASSLIAFFGPDLGRLGFGAAASSFPVLVWAGTRLGPRGAVTASFLAVLIATIATGLGSGPAVLGTMTEAALLLWGYSMFIGISALTLAAVAGQRLAAERKFRSEESERLRIEKQKLLMVERERLTREMHDGLGGQLISALSMVERGQADPSDVAETIRRAIDDFSIVMDSLDPETTDLPNSLGRLRARLESLLGRNGIDLKWRLDNIPGLEGFSPEAALHVLRIIQEAVTNTLRHAAADSAEVSITCSDDVGRRLHVSIRDDGHGLPIPMPSNGRGISNMKFRAEELGATLRIDGTNLGTEIDLTIPFPR